MLELYQLEQLMAIARCKTFSGAARELYISQPALSRSMQKLEKELGFPLFEHGKNKVSLTPTGELAVSYAREILRRVKEMQSQLAIYHKTRNTITIASCAPAPLWELVPLLGERYPDMAVASELNDSTETLTANLYDGVSRIIVTTEPLEKGGICCVPFMEEHLFLAVPKGHELAGRRKIFLKDLKDLTVILHSRIGFWYDLCKREMINPNFIMQENFEQFLTLSASSTLPFFVTDVSEKRFNRTGGQRALVHILDPEANVTFYCSALEENKEYLPRSLAESTG